MQTTKRRDFILIAVAIAMLLSGSAIIIAKKKSATGSNERLPVALRTIRLPAGWGYEVLVNDTVYIHQDCIPAINSYKQFVTETEALQIGNQVVNKIKQGQKPVVTLQDVKEAHIHY